MKMSLRGVVSRVKDKHLPIIQGDFILPPPDLRQDIFESVTLSRFKMEDISLQSLSIITSPRTHEL